MNFFFDDSGDFLLPKDTENKVSLWMGAAIPETCFDRIEKNYLDWEERSKKRLNIREIKGSLLDETNRSQFFDVINSEDDLMIQPGIVDLQIQKKYNPPDLPAVMRDLGMDASKRMKYKKDQDLKGLHGRRLGNLSTEQLLKFITLAFCIIETFRHSIMFRSQDLLRECWNNVAIFVDKSSRQKCDREELVFMDSLGSALYNMTKRRPFELIVGIHDKSHPFVKNYDSSLGINGKKLFQNLQFIDSNNHWGLRFTDIIANSMFRALNDLDNKSGALPYYKKIMKHSPLGPNSNLGIICIVGSHELNDRIKASRFAVLQQIIGSGSDS